jgi:aspartate-semialdehyde dehydrogenase
MSRDAFAVGIVGAGLSAQQIGASLFERDFPFSSLRYFGAAENVGDAVEIDEKTFTVEPMERLDGAADVVFLTRETSWSEAEVDALVLAGVTVIDCSGRYACEPDVPLIVPECNADVLREAELPAGCIVACPDPVAVALAVVLAPLREQAGVRRVVATSLEPVSEVGMAGIDELSRQTVELLQGQSTEVNVFPARISFNVLPHLGEVGPSRDSLAEEQAVWQLRRVLDAPDLPVALNRLCVPLFFGTGIVVNIELDGQLDVVEAADTLRSAPGILATSAEEERDISLADAVGQDATVVSRLRADRSADNSLSAWIALDNSRKGRAVNGVQIAEMLLRQRR